MIYNSADNKFYPELTQQLINLCQFYHCGVKIPLKAVKNYLKERKDDGNSVTIIAHPLPQKNKQQGLERKQRESMAKNILANSLSADDYQLFENDVGVLFSESRKFKFLRMNDIDGQFSEDWRLQLSQYFSKYRNEEMVLKMESDDIEYFCQKWRQLFKYTSNKYSLEPE